MLTSLAAKGFVGSTVVAAIAQAVPPSDLSGQIERTSLIGMLVIGIGILWRTYCATLTTKDGIIEKKDEQIQVMTKVMTEALVTVTDAARELRAAVNDGQQKLLEEVRRKT